MPQSAPTLSVPQMLVLRTAAERPDRMILPLPESLRVRGATQQRLLASLVRAGLAEEVPVDDDALCWRKEAGGQRFGLRATPHGVAAVEGAAPPAAGGVAGRPEPAPMEVTGPVQNEKRPVAGRDVAQVAEASPHDAPATDPASAPTQEAPEVGSTQSSIAAAHPVACRPEPAPAASRPRGKLGRLLDALSAADGASLAEIVALTGWQPHTARAALTGLRRRGFAVTRTADDAGRKAYRVRQDRPA